MNNAPERIVHWVNRSVVDAALAVLNGRAGARQLEAIFGRAGTLRLAVASRKTQGPVHRRTTVVQSLPGSLEVVALVEQDGTTHAIAMRVESRDGHARVVALESHGLL